MTPAEWSSSGDAAAMAEIIGCSGMFDRAKNSQSFLMACWFARVVVGHVGDADAKAQCDALLADWERHAWSNPVVENIATWTVPIGSDGFMPLPSPNTVHVWVMSQVQDIIKAPRNSGHWLSYTVLYAAVAEDYHARGAWELNPARMDQFKDILRGYADLIRTVFPDPPTQEPSQ